MYKLFIGGTCWIEGNSAPIETCRLHGRYQTLDSATSPANTTIPEAMASLGYENSTILRFLGQSQCNMRFVCPSQVRYVRLFEIRWKLLIFSFYTAAVQGHSYVVRSCTTMHTFCADYVRAAAKLGFNVTGDHEPRCTRQAVLFPEVRTQELTIPVNKLTLFVKLYLFRARCSCHRGLYPCRSWSSASTKVWDRSRDRSRLPKASRSTAPED
ncbi:hypothetical protein TSAR_011610 [Trichomalopsis sarcophagae]|uniref:Uncharacterized protein n=1 Tax=Trichomalopsis sarcophagae TaxID=543379 RepID=A0A232FB16_9HYME|nr:hypothetical protein TSAR_011610 [Trichomalopsis sarcophagae]